MFGTGMEFSNQGVEFAGQLIQLYTSSLGQTTYILITVATFSTMLSTTITTLDASRAMSKTIQLLFNKDKSYYLPWLLVLGLGTGAIFLFLLSEMGQLVQIATVLSFVTAPLYAYLNFRLILSKQMPKKYQPSQGLKILSVISLLFLSSLIFIFAVFNHSFIFVKKFKMVEVKEKEIKHTKTQMDSCKLPTGKI